MRAPGSAKARLQHYAKIHAVDFEIKHVEEYVLRAGGRPWSVIRKQ